MFSVFIDNSVLVLEELRTNVNVFTYALEGKGTFPSKVIFIKNKDLES